MKEGFTVEDCKMVIDEQAKIAGVPYYMDKTHDAYLKRMQIIVDAIEGQGASFSLESIEGFAFIMRSKVMEND